MPSKWKRQNKKPEKATEKKPLPKPKTPAPEYAELAEDKKFKRQE